jgi:hypothetical protein
MAHSRHGKYWLVDDEADSPHGKWPVVVDDVDEVGDSDPSLS